MNTVYSFYHFKAFEMMDDIRDDAARTIQALRARGIQPILLSGDRHEAALAFGRVAGFRDDEVTGGVTPKGKSEFVSKLQVIN